MQSERSRLLSQASASAPNAIPFDQDMVTEVAPVASNAPLGEDKYAWVQQGQEVAAELGATAAAPSGVIQAANVPKAAVTSQMNAVRLPVATAGQSERLPVMRTEKKSRRLGAIVTAGVVGLGLLAAAVGLATRGSGPEGTASPASNEPGVEADQASSTLGTTSTSLEARNTSTTVTSVALSPRNEAASTTVTVKSEEVSKPAVNSSPSTVKAQEAVTPEKRLVSSQEVQKIIDATNYQGLASHSFEIEEEFTTAAARYVVINLDGTKSVVPISELKADIAQAEADAAARPAFTSTVQLGPGVTRDITFQARPAKLTRDGTDTRYIIYTNAELDSLSAPVKGFTNASTISRPYKNLNVSLIKNQPGKKTDGFAANSFYAGVEVHQTTKHFDIALASEQLLDQEKPDMSYITSSSDPLQKKMALANIGREIYTNSLAYAQESAEAGVPYEQYKANAKQIPLRAYPNANVYYMALTAAQYSALG